MRFLSDPKNSKDENLKNKQINKNKIKLFERNGIWKKLFESQNLMDYFKINKDKIIMIIKKVIIIIIVKDKINEIK